VHSRIAIAGVEVGTDLQRPADLSLPLDFTGPQPRHFGAPRASSRPFESGAFKGAVERGASCNCELITLIPHCNGTHTECAGHLTRERLDAYRLAPAGPAAALLLSVTPEEAGAKNSEPEPQPGDLLITRRALRRAWPERLPFAPQVLVVRTLPNTPEKRARDYGGHTPAYLSREAAEFIVGRGIDHLIVDTPSIDRARDDGRLTAHRVFFGLPRAATALSAAMRANATITELAFIPDTVADGAGLVQLQVPPLCGDAVPSRPLWYTLSEIAP
jgi:arylformamidase